MSTPLAVTPAVEAPPQLQPVPVRELLPWVLFAGLLFVIALYFVGVEQGALSVVGGHWVHEFVHDARHTLGFPCH
jgi:hypothetical protein